MTVSDVYPADSGIGEPRGWPQLRDAALAAARAAGARKTSPGRRRLQMNGRNDRMTETMRVVLTAVVNGGGQAGGFSICEQTGLGAGDVYPVLDKLMAAGVITDRWEDPAPEDRDPRRYYDPAFDPSWYVANGLLPEAP